MLTKVTIKNYKSIYDSAIDLEPFTLLIGANGTGKSNFFSLLQDIANINKTLYSGGFKKHLGYPQEDQTISITNSNHQEYFIKNNRPRSLPLPELKEIRLFSLNASSVGKHEKLGSYPVIHRNGTGVVQVLDALKTGDREELFEKIESTLQDYVPEIEKLSFIPGTATKGLQVREKNILKPIPVRDLSTGTQLALIIITILHVAHTSSIICIEDIDRGLHPRLLENIVELCFDLSSQENGPQIIATTHNPYFVDEFNEHESAVIIVEKEDGKTTFTPLADRLETLDKGEEPLGSLWYSGSVGGVPQKNI